MSKPFVVVSDVHLEKALFNKVELKQDLFDKFKQTVARAIELKVSYFVVAGDLTDTNKPSAETINFLLGCVHDLRTAGVMPLAITGDHDKQVGTANWIHNVVGFKQISSVPEFIGIDYNDDAAYVLKQLAAQIEEKHDKVEFIFLHGMVPELFAFCEEKKRLILPWALIKEKCPNIKGVILGDLHKGDLKPVNGILTGYCRSLGVTAVDEAVGKRLVYFDGIDLWALPSDLIREFKEVRIDDETETQINDAFLNELSTWVDTTTAVNGKQPIIIVRNLVKYKDKIKLFDFLHQKAIVKNINLSKEKKEELNVNIRGEVANNMDFNEVLVAILNENNSYSDETYILGQQLIASLTTGDTKDILNIVKQKFIK